MSDGEIAEFVRARQSLQVATINRDGTPHLSTLWYGVLDGGEIVFETFTKSQKIKNLRRDPRIACLLEDGTVYEKLRGVQINGVAELYDDPAEVKELAKAVVAKQSPDATPDEVDAAAEFMSVKRTAVVVKPTRVVSWDHTKLGGRY